MFSLLKKGLKKIIPESLLLQYHYFQAVMATTFYRFPSKDLIVIGITGTKGKSTAANFVWSVLQKSGIECGLIGTANIRMGESEYPNHYHMTMPSPWILQRFFYQMKKRGCTAVVMEVTSEGIKQFRHLGIDFDIAAFTNLSPEHLPSHGGSFEKYKQEKKKLFDILSTTYKKEGIKKTIIVNNDDEYGDFFKDAPADEYLTYSILHSGDLQAQDIKTTFDSSIFTVGDQEFEILLPGGKNIENALLSISVGKALGLNDLQISQALLSLVSIPGRFEKIDEGQDFTVYIDYAHEEKSMQFVTDTARNMVLENNGKVIILLGAEGGGRDKSKRGKMGEIVGSGADYVVVSNVDPYEDDPTPICEDIARATEETGKIRDKNLFVIEDRRKGIQKCFVLAQKGDVIFITGKGAEQTMTINGNVIPWDERAIVREELQNFLR